MYDAKGDALPILTGIVDQPFVKTLNPFDARSVAWDIQKDMQEPRLLMQFAVSVVSAEGETQKFFIDAARRVYYGILLSYYLAGTEFNFADTLRGVESIERITAILSTNKYTRTLPKKFFSDTRLGFNILSTLQAKLLPFEPIAACWEHAKEKVSIRDWVTSNQILVLGNSEESRFAVDTINQCIVRRATEVILSQPETRSSQTWIIIDEVADAGNSTHCLPLRRKADQKGLACASPFRASPDFETLHYMDSIGLTSCWASLEIASSAGSNAYRRLIGFQNLSANKKCFDNPTALLRAVVRAIEPQ